MFEGDEDDDDVIDDDEDDEKSMHALADLIVIFDCVLKSEVDETDENIVTQDDENDDIRVWLIYELLLHLLNDDDDEHLVDYDDAVEAIAFDMHNIAVVVHEVGHEHVKTDVHS